MEKNVLDYVVEKTKELIAAPSCSQEAKEAAQAWLDAVGTEKEAEETKKYIARIRRRYCDSGWSDRFCTVRGRS